MKRILGFVLAIVVAFTSVPVYAVEEDVQLKEVTEEDVAKSIKKEEINYKRSKWTGYISLDNEVETPSMTVQDKTSLEESLPSSYQSYEDVKTKYPATRNQNPYGTCWAFASVACGEVDLVKAGAIDKENADFSELQLAYNMYHPGNDKLGNLDGDETKLASDARYNYLDMGGNIYFAQHILANWRGLVVENELPYGDAASTLTTPLLESYSYANDGARLLNSRMIDMHDDVSSVKEAIYNHGAVYASYYHNSLYYTYRNGKALYNYSSNISMTNHAIAIVGWDDNFSRENWASWNRPSKNGAWLVRNSWSTESKLSEYSYFWMSYEDKSLADSAYVLDYETADNTYDNIYQHDGSASHAGISCYQAANVFTAQNPDSAPSETLEAVMISMTNDISARMEIKVYTGVSKDWGPQTGTLHEEATTMASVDHAGIYTFKLKNPVELTEGERYSIVITTTSGTAYYDLESSDVYSGWIQMNAGIDKGESYWKPNKDYGWSDVSNIGNGYGNICIKGLTNNSEEEVHVHSFEEIITKASESADGKVEQRCTSCGYSYVEQVILKPTAELEYDKITYSGSAINPKVTVTNKEGTVSAASYDITYEKNISVGRAKVTVQLAEDLYEPIVKYFTIVPKAPASSNARLDETYNKVKYSWESSKGATGYAVYFKQSTASTYSLITRTTGTSLTKSGLSAGKSYTFKVVPYYTHDGIRYASLQSETDSVYTLKKLDKPTVSKDSSGKVTVKWKNISGETGYQISCSTKRGSTNIVSTVETTSGTSKVLSVKPDVDYYYKVRAYSTVDGKKIYGPWSDTYKFKLNALAKMAKPSVSKYSAYKVKVKWENISGESGYQISRSKSSTGTSIVSTYATTKGTYKVLTTTRGVTYYYKVRAYKTVSGKKVYGPWSDTYKYKLK